MVNFCRILFTLTSKAVNTQHKHMRPAEIQNFFTHQTMPKSKGKDQILNREVQGSKRLER